jgi:chromosome segregation ATPase
MLSLKSAKPPAPDPNQSAEAATAQAAEVAQAAQAAQAELAGRDARIKELERILAEEKQLVASLRETVDSLQFKTQVLEKSYAKQLADTRSRLSAAEHSVAEQKQKEATHGSDREETIRLLSEARTELEQVKLDRDQLRAQLRRSNGWSANGPAAEPAEASEGTINQLMAGAGWQKKAAAIAASSHLDAKVSADEDAPPEQMIDPELVFTKDKQDD